MKKMSASIRNLSVNLDLPQCDLPDNVLTKAINFTTVNGKLVTTKMSAQAPVNTSGWLPLPADSVPGPVLPIPLVFPSTGEGLSPGVIDINYKLAVLQGTTVPISNNSYVISSGLYAGEVHGNSKTIAPDADTTQPWDDATSGVNGIYRYRLSFDLTTYLLSSIILAANVGSDNTVVVNLNSVQIATSGVGATTSFTVDNTTLIQGLNTLDFIVTNTMLEGIGNNPTMLYVDFTSRSGALL